MGVTEPDGPPCFQEVAWVTSYGAAKREETGGAHRARAPGVQSDGNGPRSKWTRRKGGLWVVESSMEFCCKVGRRRGIQGPVRCGEGLGFVDYYLFLIQKRLEQVSVWEWRWPEKRGKMGWTSI